MKLPHDDSADQLRQFDIAIVGLAGRFPGADNLDQFWSNLRSGKESITYFSQDQLVRSGLPDELLANPQYVKAAPILNDPSQFDADFFGYSPREAQCIDPQQRLFL